VLRPTGTTRQRWLARVAACAASTLIALGCQPAPTAAPPTALPLTSESAGPPLSATQAPLSSPAAPIAFADAVRDALDVDGIRADLDRLQSITMAHGGARPAGSDGHAAAANFVADELRAAGYAVELQQVDLPVFRQIAPSSLEIMGGGGRAFDDTRDFKAMLFSQSGEVTAPLFALGFNPQAQSGDTGGLGCNPEDWADVPADVIVLVQPAGCRRHDVVVQAQAAGAVGIVTSYPAWSRDRVLRPTLINPADIRIPAIGTTSDVGLALNDAAAHGASVRIAVHASNENGSSVNVIGETPWGDPTQVVMLGGHLDSVVDGPGMNDDGSGTMTVLGIAKALASITGMAGPAATPPAPARKVRVAFWTGEELGLWGSRAYVSGLSSTGNIAAYLNFDMIGSSNGVREVYDGASSSRPTEGVVIAGLFSRALDDAGLAWQAVPLGGSSDHFSFDQAGIPTGGLFSGANELKSDTQAQLFGGEANAAEDACYHLACDTADQIDRNLLGDLAGTAAWTVGALASGQVDLSGR
jgi:Zn-dependent M28 family amino/carboxypeptidase